MNTDIFNITLTEFHYKLSTACVLWYCFMHKGVFTSLFPTPIDNYYSFIQVSKLHKLLGERL